MLICYIKLCEICLSVLACRSIFGGQHNRSHLSCPWPIAVLVDFWAQWCGYCRMLFPVLDEIATELGDRLTVVKVNVDENQVTAQRYGVLALPTLVVVRDGEVISRFVGARSKRRLLADLSALL
jgi:thioredoxin 1